MCQLDLLVFTYGFKMLLYLLSEVPRGDITKYFQKLGMDIYDNENQPGIRKVMTEI